MNLTKCENSPSPCLDAALVHKPAEVEVFGGAKCRRAANNWSTLIGSTQHQIVNYECGVAREAF